MRIAFSLRHLITASIFLFLSNIVAASENNKICVNEDGTGGLKPEIIAETCMRWWSAYDSTFASGTEGQFLLGKYQDECELVQNNNVTCFWRTGEKACEARLLAFNNVSHPGVRLKFASKPRRGTRDYWDCSWGFPKESKNSDGLYTSKFTAIRVPAERMSYCEIPVAGPYNSCPPTFEFCGVTYNQYIRGLRFSPKQKQMIYAANAVAMKQAHPQARGFMSDLGGYIFKKSPGSAPCISPVRGPGGFCREPTIMTPNLVAENLGNPGLVSRPNVHHVIPRVDRRGCPCGTNSPSNAAMISNELNGHFLNYKRPADEIALINSKGETPYACSAPTGAN